MAQSRSGQAADDGVVRDRASHRVVQEVERALAQGELGPGDRLPSERELSSRLGVSRPTVREAMHMLASDGLLTSHPRDPGGGWRIQEPGHLPFHRMLMSASRLHDVAYDLMEFRVFLEGTAAHLAALHRTEEQLAEIRGRQATVRELIDGDAAAFGEADAAFHHAVAVASGNRLVVMCSSGCRSAIRDLIGDLLLKTQDPGAVMRDYVRRHELIVEAVADRDAHRAELRAAGDILDCHSPSEKTVSDRNPRTPLRTYPCDAGLTSPQVSRAISRQRDV